MVIPRPKLIRYAKKKYKIEEEKFISIRRLKLVLSVLEEIIAERLVLENKIKLHRLGCIYNKKYRWKGETFYIPKFKPSKSFNKELNKPREVF